VMMACDNYDDWQIHSDPHSATSASFASTYLFTHDCRCYTTPVAWRSIVVNIDVARIFRGWVRPGFLVGGRWRVRRPRARRTRRKAPERWGKWGLGRYAV